MKKFVLFSGNANLPLAKKVAEILNLGLSKIKIARFSDGEIYVNVLENIKKKKIFILQSTSYPTNETLMELLIMIDAIRGQEPKKIIAILPFYGYRRQEKKTEPGESLSFALVAKLLRTAGLHKIIVLDLHKYRSKRFFNFQRKELRALPLFVEYFKKMDLTNFVVVAPDKGSMYIVKKYSHILGLSIVKAYKRRRKHDEAILKKLEGDVNGKNAIIIDDEINTAGTLVNVVTKLKERGAKDIYFAATHGVLSGPAVERLKILPIKEVILTDSINIPPEKLIPKIKILSVAPLIAQAILDD